MERETGLEPAATSLEVLDFQSAEVGETFHSP